VISKRWELPKRFQNTVIPRSLRNVTRNPFSRPFGAQGDAVSAAIALRSARARNRNAFRKISSDATSLDDPYFLGASRESEGRGVETAGNVTNRVLSAGRYLLHGRISTLFFSFLRLKLGSDLQDGVIYYRIADFDCSRSSDKSRLIVGRANEHLWRTGFIFTLPIASSEIRFPPECEQAWSDRGRKASVNYNYMSER